MIDARGLTFINHRGLAALVDGLARRCAGVSLLGGPALVTRVRPGLGIGDDMLDACPTRGDRFDPPVLRKSGLLLTLTQ